MTYSWIGTLRIHTSTCNAMEKGGCVWGHRDAGMRDHFLSDRLGFPFSPELFPKICIPEMWNLGIFFNKLGNYSDYRKCRCCQPAPRFCKLTVKICDALFITWRLMKGCWGWEVKDKEKPGNRNGQMSSGTDLWGSKGGGRRRNGAKEALLRYPCLPVHGTALATQVFCHLRRWRRDK